MTEQTFEIGQVFEGEYPPEAAGWCNENNAYIDEIDSVEKEVEETVEPEEGAEGSDESSTTKKVMKTFRRFEIKEVPEPTTEELAAQVRAQRDALIAATDYLMASDYPLTDEKRTELTTYRQALRDVPEQEGFPTSVVWPEKPEWLK